MEIAEIKQRLSILTVLKSYNLQPDKHQMLKCPFHKDDKPSLKIYTETNTFNCFGCNANGDTIEFIQKKENLSKHQALVKASELVEAPSQPSPRGRSQEPPKINRTTLKSLLKSSPTSRMA